MIEVEEADTFQAKKLLREYVNLQYTINNFNDKVGNHIKHLVQKYKVKNTQEFLEIEHLVPDGPDKDLMLRMLSENKEI